MNNQAIIEKIVDLEIKRFKKLSEDENYFNNKQKIQQPSLVSLEENIKKSIPMILKNLDTIDKENLNIKSFKYIYDPVFSHRCHFLEINGIRHSVVKEDNTILIFFNITDNLILEFESFNIKDDLILFFDSSKFSKEYQECFLTHDDMFKGSLFSVVKYIENEIISTPKLFKKINNIFCLLHTLCPLILLIEKSRQKFKIEDCYNIELFNTDLEKFDTFNLLYDLDIKKHLISLKKNLELFNSHTSIFPKNIIS